MSIQDLLYISRWELALFIIGLIFLPFTTFVFHSFIDKGYIFSKIIGAVILSYFILIFGAIHIIPFTKLSSALILILLIIFSFLPDLSLTQGSLILKKRFFKLLRNNLGYFILEELIFFAALIAWAYVRIHQPEIRGLEKYMDFGFINSILRSEYFPPKDMWFTPFTINYYYFGHFITAVLTKLSDIPSFITFNLMIATLFSFTFSSSFSIGANLINFYLKNKKQEQPKQRQNKIYSDSFQLFKLSDLTLKSFIGGLLAAFLVALAGNLHTLYTLFLPYQNEYPVTPWKLAFSPINFPNAYWYPNATRFIENTIHEFPIYSFVVSDLHGHVLDIPIVLTIIAFLLHEFIYVRKKLSYYKIFFLSFLIAVAYMTNAWDGVIYLLLAIIIITFISVGTDFIDEHNKIYWNTKHILSLLNISKLKNLSANILLLIAGFFIFSLPFSLNFKPFASSIGILCAPDFLTKIGKFGPFLFEADHCQKSPFWQIIILYGFFYFWIFLFILLLRRIKKIDISDFFVIILIIFSTILIIIPEFIYIKDIYPTHYRANTMFKLVYQAFILLSFASTYIIIKSISILKIKFKPEISHENSQFSLKLSYLKRSAFVFVSCLILFLVFIYPYFSISSYYEEFKTKRSLDGILYLKNLYPTDYEAILWISKNIQGQPVILEAQGDSYTDYARISANTGLPTVLGWTVHEWLWRGTYDIPAPRISEIQTIYETKDKLEATDLLTKYDVRYVFVGDLEIQKYPNLNQEKFEKIGKIIYKNGKTLIYQINI